MKVSRAARPESAVTEAGSYDVTLKLDTGTHTSRINQLLVTRDEQMLISVGEKSLRIWNMETRRLQRMLMAQGGRAPGGIVRAALSPDDRFVVVLAWRDPPGSHGELDRDTDVRVFELSTGNLHAHFPFSGTLHDIDFSPDGTYIALVGSPREKTRRRYLQVLESAALLESGGVMPASVATSTLIEDDHDALAPTHVRFVPAQPGTAAGYQIVVAAGCQQNERGSKYSGQLQWYSLARPGTLLKLTAARETEEQLVPGGLAVSRDFVIVTGDLNRAFCHDHSGKLIAAIDTRSVPAAPAFSPDGRQLVLGQKGDSALVEVSVYDVALGQFRLRSTYHGHDAQVMAACLLRHGGAVSAGGDQNAIHFWSPVRFEAEQTGVIKGVGRAIHAVGIRADDEIALGNYDDLRSADGSIVLQRLFSLRDMTLRPLSIHDSAGFQRAQIAAGDKRLELKSHLTRQSLYLVPHQQDLLDALPLEDAAVTTFGFTPNGMVIVGANDGTLQAAVPDARRRRMKSARYLVGHTAAVLDHAAGRKWLVTAGADQVVRLWCMDDLKAGGTADLYPALNLFVGSDDEWVIWSKSGYYNASQRGDRRFGFQVDRGPDKEAVYFSSDRFIKALFRPDVIQAIVACGSEERALAELQQQGHPVPPLEIERILPPIVELEENGLAATSGEIRLAFTAGTLSAEAAITRVWVVHNERFAWESRTPRKTYRIRLPLLPGRNTIKVLAENESTKSQPLILAVTGPRSSKASAGRGVRHAARSSRGGRAAAGGGPGKHALHAVNTIMGDGTNAVPDNGVLHLLAVGVSRLKKPRPDKGYNNLHFADEDAIAIYNALARARFSDALEKAGRPLNRAFRSVEATILLNEQATRAAILAAIGRISGRIRSAARKEAAQRDVLFVFLSGHGVRLTDTKSHDQELFFWNYDLDFDHLGRTGLSLIDLGKQITSVPADVVLATDACHSGLAGGEVARGLDPNELAKRIYAINERGMYILNAARSEELAIESGRKDFDHGVFTKSILETLQVDRSVSMMELIASVQQRVEYYTNRQQTPICRLYGDLLPLTIYER